MTDLPRTVQPDSPNLDLQRLGYAGARRSELRSEDERLVTEVLVELERVERAGGNQRLKLVASLVGLHRDTLRSKLAERKLARPPERTPAP